eukprot:3845014-Pyramimonas_sp.AAC.1
MDCHRSWGHQVIEDLQCVWTFHARCHLLPDPFRGPSHVGNANSMFSLSMEEHHQRHSGSTCQTCPLSCLSAHCGARYS